MNGIDGGNSNDIALPGTPEGSEAELSDAFSISDVHTATPLLAGDDLTVFDADVKIFFN